MDSRKLTLSQLDRSLAAVREAMPAVEPRGGWIRTLREALGMTAAQLAKRLGISRQAVGDAERREAHGDITLVQLRRFAAALDGDLVYAIVPRRTLREAVEARADSLAREEVARISHSMTLEAQGTDPTLASERVEQVKQSLLAHRWSRLWD